MSESMTSHFEVKSQRKRSLDTLPFSSELSSEEEKGRKEEKSRQDGSNDGVVVGKNYERDHLITTGPLHLRTFPSFSGSERQQFQYSPSSSLHSPTAARGPLAYTSIGAKQLIGCLGGKGDIEGAGALYIPPPLPSLIRTYDTSQLSTATTINSPITTASGEEDTSPYQYHTYLRNNSSFYFRKLPKAYRSPSQRSHCDSPLLQAPAKGVRDYTTGSDFARHLRSTVSTTSSSTVTAEAASSRASHLSPKIDSSMSHHQFKAGNNSLCLDSMTVGRAYANSHGSRQRDKMEVSDPVSSSIPMFPIVSLESYRAQLATLNIHKSTARSDGQHFPPRSNTQKRFLRGRAESQSNDPQYRPGSWLWYSPPTSAHQQQLPQCQDDFPRPSTGGSLDATRRREATVPLNAERNSLMIFTNDSDKMQPDAPRSGWDDDDDDTISKSNGPTRWETLRFKSLKRKEVPKYPPNSSSHLYHKKSVSTSTSMTGGSHQVANDTLSSQLYNRNSPTLSSSHFVTAQSRLGSSQSSQFSQHSSSGSNKPVTPLTPTPVKLSPKPSKGRPVLIRSDMAPPDTYMRSNALTKGITVSYSQPREYPNTDQRMQRAHTVNHGSNERTPPHESSYTMSKQGAAIIRRTPLPESYLRTMGWTKSGKIMIRRKPEASEQSIPHRISFRGDQKIPLDCPLFDVLKESEASGSGSGSESQVRNDGRNIDQPGGLSSPIQLVEKALPRKPAIVEEQLNSVIDALEEEGEDGEEGDKGRAKSIGQHSSKSIDPSFTPESCRSQTNEETSPHEPPTPSSTQCSPLASFYGGFEDQKVTSLDQQKWYADARIGKSTFGGIEEEDDDLTGFPLWQGRREGDNDDSDEDDDNSDIMDPPPAVPYIKAPYEGLFDAYINSDSKTDNEEAAVQSERRDDNDGGVLAEMNSPSGGSTETLDGTATPTALRITSQGIDIAFDDDTATTRIAVKYHAELTAGDQAGDGKRGIQFTGAIILKDDDLERICQSCFTSRQNFPAMTLLNLDHAPEDVQMEAPFPNEGDGEEEKAVMEKRQEDLKRECSAQMRLLRKRSLSRKQMSSRNEVQEDTVTPSSSSRAESPIVGTPHIKQLLLVSSLQHMKQFKSSTEDSNESRMRWNNQSSLRRVASQRPLSSSTGSAISVKGVSITYRSPHFFAGPLAPEAT